MENKKRFGINPLIRAVFIVAILLSGQPFFPTDAGGAILNSASAMEAGYFEVTEGNDFATQVMRDPWDMSEFTDISHYLNPSTSPTLMTNIAVNDGIFSARSTSARQASFYPLFPGYDDALQVGKIGAVYPIDPNKYKCFYAAAKVDSGAPQNGSPDQMVVYWFANEKLNRSTFGQTLPGIVLYPEAGTSTPTPRWKLYSARLDQVPSYYNAWLNAPNGQWRGLRIDATLQETTFAFDWVRLTDCNPVNISIPWSGSGSVSISIAPEGTSREILVQSNIRTSPYTLDVQGFQPGTYQYFVRNSTTLLSTGTIKINPAPIVEMLNPSPISGEDLATKSGNAWDMEEEFDINNVKCTNARFESGNLVLETPPLSAQPPECVYDGISDARFNLATTLEADTSQYRYLSFRIFTDAPNSDYGLGMIARFVWYLQGVSGLPDNRCLMVSDDIPYDVDWYTISVDLHDELQGLAEENSIVDCPSEMSWTQNSPALLFRFDPNENISENVFYQKIDWIKLTKVEEIRKGTNYLINLNQNIPWANITDHRLFYTTDLDNPTQFTANSELLQENLNTTNFTNAVYLPSIIKGNIALDKSEPSLPYSQTLVWNTATVNPGEYYLCLQVTANGKTTTTCSEAPVIVK